MRAPAHIAATFAATMAAPFMMQTASASHATTPASPLASEHRVAQDETKQTKQTADDKKTSKAPVKSHKPTVEKVTVKAGDSLSKIAATHHTTWIRLFDANTTVVDPNLIHPGMKLTVPTKHQKLSDRYGKLTSRQVATMPAVSTAQVRTAATPASYAPTSTHAGTGGPNAYANGYCTWYVKNMRPDIGGYWGNAGYSWLNEARSAGFSTGTAPRAGAVAVTGGHVAYVDSVSNGKVHISEMNYAGGVGVVHYRTVSPGSFDYIY